MNKSIIQTYLIAIISLVDLLLIIIGCQNVNAIDSSARTLDIYKLRNNNNTFT